MRSIRILKVGETNGKPWARGVVDFETPEMLAAMQAAASNGAKAPSAAFGLVSGLPDDAIARLVPGDVVTATEVTVRVRPDSYETEDGTTVNAVTCRIQVAGKASKTAAPTATCDW